MSDDHKNLKAHLADIFEDLAKLDYFMPKDQVERRQAREARRDRLERAKPAVTSSDIDQLIAGRLALDTHALRVTQQWLELAFGEDARQRALAPRYLVLSGGPGRGKTVAAAWVIANEVSRYITAAELRRIRASHNPRDTETLFQVNGARVLVLDDLGVERLDDGSEEMMFDLMNERQNRRYTLITTNLDEAQMRTRYGDRAIDRITGQGGFVPVKGENLRERRRAL